MSLAVLTLGPIEFSAFEVPSSISFGGCYRIGIHQLANGMRSIDALGADDYDIRFSGTFSGQNAMARAIALDDLRRSGAILPLRWADFSYYVIIRSFVAEFRHSSWIPFKIACIVAQNEAIDAGGQAFSSSVSISVDVQSGLAAAALLQSEGINDDSNDAAIEPALIDKVKADPTQISCIVQSLSSNVERLNTEIETANSVDLHEGIAGLSTFCGLLWSYVTSRAYFSRAQASTNVT